MYGSPWACLLQPPPPHTHHTSTRMRFASAAASPPLHTPSHPHLDALRLLGSHALKACALLASALRLDRVGPCGGARVAELLEAAALVALRSPERLFGRLHSRQARKDKGGRCGGGRREEARQFRGRPGGRSGSPERLLGRMHGGQGRGDLGGWGCRRAAHQVWRNPLGVRTPPGGGRQAGKEEPRDYVAERQHSIGGLPWAEGRQSLLGSGGTAEPRRRTRSVREPAAERDWGVACGSGRARERYRGCRPRANGGECLEDGVGQAACTCGRMGEAKGPRSAARGIPHASRRLARVDVRGARAYAREKDGRERRRTPGRRGRAAAVSSCTRDCSPARNGRGRRRRARG
eukprot:362727-Chlamydomonas_euryale.AAC.2